MSFSCCLFGKPVITPKHQAASEKKEDELKRVASATSALSGTSSSSTVPPRCTPRAGEVSLPAAEDPDITAAIANAASLAPLPMSLANNRNVLTPQPPVVASTTKQKKSMFTFGL